LEDVVDDNDRTRQLEIAHVKSEKAKYEEMLASSISSMSVPVTLSKKKKIEEYKEMRIE
jgi:hypothetical protein